MIETEQSPYEMADTNTEIIVICLVVLALITCLILLYFLISSYMNIDISMDEIYRTLREAEAAANQSVQSRSFNRNTIHAISNEYQPHPVQRAPPRPRTMDPSVLNAINVPTNNMRFYTAEELLNFPFDLAQIELHTMNRPSNNRFSTPMAPTPLPDYLAMPPSPIQSSARARPMSAAAGYNFTYHSHSVVVPPTQPDIVSNSGSQSDSFANFVSQSPWLTSLPGTHGMPVSFAATAPVPLTAIPEESTGRTSSITSGA